jgi:IS5 family transposase
MRTSHGIRTCTRCAKDFTNQRARKGGEVDADEQRRNRTKSKVRARVEHAFAVIKRLWGFAKVTCSFFQRVQDQLFMLAPSSLY